MRFSDRELLVIRGALMLVQEYAGGVDKEEKALFEKCTKELLRRRASEKVGA